jgi:peptidyl-tRNA hydrolase
MKIHHKDKLYIVVRRDLAPGHQACQSIHAAQQFAFHYPAIQAEWLEQSNYLALLSCADEQALKRLTVKAVTKGLKCSLFAEPDFGMAYTALAIQPSPKAKLLCKGLPLALKHSKTLKKRGH